MVFQPQAESATISVSSYEGGTRLNFGNVDASTVISRELEIAVTSQDNVAYQVRQIILHPLTSRKGETLRDDVLSFYTVRGSNARGSLYKTIRQPLSFKDEILYASDSQGTSDSFKLIYIFDGKKLKTPGSFYGRISYVLETRQGQSQTAIFDIEFNAQLELEVNVEMLGRPLRLSTKSETDGCGYVDFHITASAGRELDLYQRPEIFPSNFRGVALPQGSIKFFISDSLKRKGEYKNPTAIEKKELLIYTSGEGSDSFRINFIIDREMLKDIASGTYAGKLIYRLQEEGREKVIPVDIEVIVEEVFDMKITSEGLSFHNIKPDSLPQEKSVLIEVKNNLQTAYQISQTVSNPLTDSEGNTIAAENFSMRGELLEGQGEVMFTQFEPVEIGEEIIFVSGSRGTDSSLRIIYRLSPSIDILAGKYSGSVTYSLSEK